MNLSFKSLKDSLMQTTAVEAISEKAILASHYTIIHKAIDPGYSETTPGYIYEELIQLSYEGNLAEGLASSLVSHLGNTKVRHVEKQLKVLKTLYTVSTKGSRLFRRSLRKPNNDEHLRAAAKRGNSSSSQFASPGGTSKEDQIRKLATEIRVYLFSDSVMEQDESTEPEIPPQKQHTLSGMGGGENTGKYDGFGNSPIHKENYGDKVADFIEKAITIPDERKEVMEMCLASPSTGDFKPISLPGLQSNSDSYHSNSSSMHISSFGEFPPSSGSGRVGQKHIPGKAGGGWEDDTQDDHLPVEFVDSKKTSDSSKSTACADSDTERILVNNFCKGHEKLPTTGELEQFVDRVCNLNPSTILHHLAELIQSFFHDEHTKANNTILRVLLALESMLRTSLLKPEVYENVLSDKLTTLASENTESLPAAVAIKSKKILLIIQGLIKCKEE